MDAEDRRVQASPCPIATESVRWPFHRHFTRHPRSPSLAPATLTAAILQSLDDAKAEDVLSIELQGKTTIADTMVVATGRSTTHVGAIADRVTRACKDAGILAKVEGLPHCDWVLVDAGDVIVHLFRPEVRSFYNLEKLWGVDRPSEHQAG